MKSIFLTLTVLLGIQAFTFSQSVIISPNGDVEQRSSGTSELKMFGNPTEIKGSGYLGSLDNPQAVTAGFQLFRMDGAGYNGSLFTSQRAGIRFQATENWNTTSNGTSIRFGTTENNTDTFRHKMILDHKGYLGIGTFGGQTFPDIEKKLHVEDGDAMIENTNPFLFLKTSGVAGTGNAGINFGNSLNQTKAVINYDQTDEKLRIVNGTSTSDGIYVAKGNSNINLVGIGLNDPSGKLHIKSNSLIGEPQLMLEENNTSDYGRINFNNSSSSEYWALAGKTDGIVGNARFNIYSSHFGNVASFYGNGNTQLAGFTQLGSSAPKIKMVKLSGTTDASTTTTIAHSSTIGKVIEANVFVYFTSSLKIPPGHSSAVYSYNMEINDADIRLTNVVANMQDKTYEVFLTIEE